MSPTDASESMLESTIVRSLVNNAGYIEGDPKDFMIRTMQVMHD